MWARLPKPHAIADACGRALRRSLAPAAAVAVLGAIGGAVWAGYHWISTSPRFAITAIAIQGTRHVDPDDLLAALPIRVGDNVFVGLDRIARAARANPWIASAEVRRILPHTIAVDVREHTAAAVAELGELGELYLVEATGQPFKRAALEAGEGEGLPIITGIGRAAYAADPAAAMATVRDALAALDGWRAADRPAIGEIHVDSHGAVTLHTYDQAIAIQLGAVAVASAAGSSASAGPDALLGQRLHTFDAAWAGLSETERARTRAIHLDARPDHVTVAFAKD
jgi:cell division protein FtsQ